MSFHHSRLNKISILEKTLISLLSILLLTACTHSSHQSLQSGTTGYSHYSNGGRLHVSGTFGPDGRLWRVVPEKDAIYVDASSDLGQTFTSPVKINTEDQKIKVSGENRPSITVDHSGFIDVIYAAESTQPVSLFFSQSKDNGQSFSTPIPLSDKAADANTFQGKFTKNLDGKVYSFWHDERNRTDWRQSGNAIFFTTIDEKSGLPVPAKLLSETLCDCCRIAAAFDKDNEAVLLTRLIYPVGIRDHGLLKTQPEGKIPQSWRVTFDDWIIEGCPEHGPAIAISQDNRYHIAWFTQGKIRKGLFYAYSDDGGHLFSPPLSFGELSHLPSHPDILVLGKKVTLTWIEFDGNQTELKIMQSNNNGKTWLPAKLIARVNSAADFPFLLNKQQIVYVSWNSKNGGYKLLPIP